MILIFLGLILITIRYRLLSQVLGLISRMPAMDRSLLFHLTLSLDQNIHRIYLMNLLNRLLECLIIIFLSAGVGQLFGFSLRWLLLFIVLAVIGSLLHLSQQIKSQHARLLERLQRFLFFYEMSLMNGSHQYRALREATDRTELFEHYETVNQYIDAANQLYSFVQWMVIKKMAILLERNQSFSNEDLTVEFVELSQEVYQRYAQGERLKLERRENLMLIPMTFNMLLMITYLIAPFVKELL